MDLQEKRITALSGGLMIVVGIAFLAGQVFQIRLGQYVWPFLVIIPGLALLTGALTWQEASVPLAIVGGIATMVGVVLLFQSITGAWASWTYAWALVAPIGPGLGMWLVGTLKNRAQLVKSGSDLIRVGLIIFVVMAAFFELLIGVSGSGLNRYGLPLLLIALGLFLLARDLHLDWRKA